MVDRIVVNPTSPPTIGDDNIRSANKWDNVFVLNKDGQTIALDALLREVAAEVQEASSLQLLRSILVELRAQSHILAAGFDLGEAIDSYRGIEPVTDH